MSQDQSQSTVGRITFGPSAAYRPAEEIAADIAAGRLKIARAPAPGLSAEDRASLFIEWCALQGFGKEGWPPGAYEQLVAHLREAANGR